MLRLCSGRLAAGLLAVLPVLTAPAVARGQAGWYLEPSLSLTEEYDDNLFGQPSSKRSDFVTRLTLGLGAGYRSAPFTLFGTYSVGSELYAETSELNGFANRQNAGLEVGYLPTQSLSFRLLGSYARSETSTVALAPALAGTPSGPGPGSPGAEGATAAPSGVEGAAGAPPPGVPAVEVGARRSTTIGAAPTVSYALTPRTSVEGGYVFTRITTSATGVPPAAGTEPAPRPDTTDLEHEVQVRLVYQLGPLDRGTAGYRIRYFDSDQVGSTTSHVVTLGWSRDLTEATTLSLEVGPRFTDGDTDVEARARLEHRLRAVRFTLAYARSQGLVAGRSGAQTTDTGSVEVAYQPLRELLLVLGASIVHASSEPSAGRNGGSGEAAATDATGSEDQLTYRIGATLAYRLTEWLTAYAAYSFSIQEEADETIRHHIVSVGLTLMYPVRVR